MELVQRSQNKFKNVTSLKKEKVYKTKTNKLNVKVKPSLNHSTIKKDGSKAKKGILCLYVFTKPSYLLTVKGLSMPLRNKK